MRKYLGLALIALAVSCNNQPRQGESGSPGSTEFFPLASFIADQLKTVDSLKLPLTKVVTENGQSTTSSADFAELRDSAQQFLKPDITVTPLKEKYTETSFADQSIPSINLNYSTTNKELPVQRLDVILKPDPIESDKVQSVYLEKTQHVNGLSLRTKLLWQANKSFQIISSHDTAVSIVKFNWDAPK